MKILFYDTKNYDKESFQAILANYPNITIEYTKSDLDPRTAALAEGFDAVCAFVSSDIGTETLDIQGLGAYVGADEGADCVEALGQGGCPGIQVGFGVLDGDIGIVCQDGLERLFVIVFGVVE